ncbi:MAG: hypothetical protein WB799_21185 [Candidatus Sulfotelmatobacter sp.]
MWGQPPRLSSGVERAPSPAAFDFDFAFDLVGELACKERSDEAGQFVGKRAGSAAAGAARGAKRRPQPRRRRCLHRPSTVSFDKNKSGRPKAARVVLG